MNGNKISTPQRRQNMVTLLGLGHLLMRKQNTQNTALPKSNKVSSLPLDLASLSCTMAMFLEIFAWDRFFRELSFSYLSAGNER